MTTMMDMTDEDSLHLGEDHLVTTHLLEEGEHLHLQELVPGEDSLMRFLQRQSKRDWTGVLQIFS